MSDNSKCRGRNPMSKPFSERLEYFRIERPSEWLMDDFASNAKNLEETIERLVGENAELIEGLRYILSLSLYSDMDEEIEKLLAKHKAPTTSSDSKQCAKDGCFKTAIGAGISSHCPEHEDETTISTCEEFIRAVNGPQAASSDELANTKLVDRARKYAEEEKNRIIMSATNTSEPEYLHHINALLSAINSATSSDVTKDELLRECADKLERGIESACATEPEWSKQDRKLVSRIKAALEQAQ
jgi:hypothetical protein